MARKRTPLSKALARDRRNEVIAGRLKKAGCHFKPTTRAGFSPYPLGCDLKKASVNNPVPKPKSAYDYPHTKIGHIALRTDIELKTTIRHWCNFFDRPGMVDMGIIRNWYALRRIGMDRNRVGTREWREVIMDPIRKSLNEQGHLGGMCDEEVLIWYLEQEMKRIGVAGDLVERGRQPRKGSKY